MKTVRIGIIGTGFGASVHLPAFRRIAGVEIAGIASRNMEHAEKISEKENIPATSVQEMMADSSIDAVSIVTPPASHREITCSAFAAGKSVLCEKPLALTVADARAIVDAAKVSGKTAMMDFSFRGHPAFAALHKWLQKEGGEIRHFISRWHVGSWADPSRGWGWQGDAAEGGGILGALAVHALDYTEWMCGSVRTLTAQTGMNVKERKDATGKMQTITAPDRCDTLLTLKNGASATLSIANGSAYGTGHRIEVHCEKKSIILESTMVMDYAKGFTLKEGRLGSRDLRDITPVFAGENLAEDGRISMLLPVVETFIEAVRNGIKVTPSIEDGFRARVLLEAIGTAAREHRWVDVSAS